MTALHTMEEVAQKLRTSRRWLQDFIKRHPYYRVSAGKKVFTDADVNRLIEALPCPSNSSRPAKARRRTGTAKAPTSAEPSKNLTALGVENPWSFVMTDPRYQKALAIVAEQADDDGLWFVAETCAEAYLQKALRELHAAIEGEKIEYC